MTVQIRYFGNPRDQRSETQVENVPRWKQVEAKGCVQDLIF